MWWHHKGECATLLGKIIEKYLEASLIKHEIKRKFICFAYKIEIYFIREHQLFYLHSWLCHSWKLRICCSLSEICFNLTCKTKHIVYVEQRHTKTRHYNWSQYQNQEKIFTITTFHISPKSYCNNEIRCSFKHLRNDTAVPFACDRTRK
jgi:hypothetical protein